MKKFIYVISIIVLGSLIWYLFLKPYDYIVAIEAKTIPGAINQTIKTWSMSLDNSKIIEQKNIYQLKQKIVFNDSTFIYKWNIIRSNDSTSKIKVSIKDVDNSLRNRIIFPFNNTDFEKRIKNSLLDFNKKLNQHINKFKVTIKGKDELKSTYCAYVSIKSTQVGKASGMMLNYSLLSTILVKNNVELNGKPFVEITHWNMDKDSIIYNFCYPIIKNDSLPQHELIKYKRFEGKKVLKAIYNGNYITSDRAWYALMDYASINNIKIEKKPVEIFYNNPNFGGDQLKWVAEVYLPIK